MRAVIAIALNGFREGVRNRVTLIVAFFAVAMLLATSLVTEATVATFDRVITDVGLGSMSIMLALLAVFLSSGMLGREIERRTIFLMVSKPISRGTFLVGRLAGNMLILAVLLAAMIAIFVFQLALFRSPLTQPQVVASLLLWVELLVLSSIGFAMSSFAGQFTSAMVTVGLYFAGHMSRDIYQLAEKSSSAGLAALGKALYYVLPNLERLNFRPQATYMVPVPWELALSSALYGFAYAGAMTALAVLLFSRRDFR